MLYDVNLGTRDYFTYTDAMLNNSLFSEFLKRNGLNVYRKKQDQEFSKDESIANSVSKSMRILPVSLLPSVFSLTLIIAARLLIVMDLSFIYTITRLFIESSIVFIIWNLSK